jgi:MFS family permease
MDKINMSVAVIPMSREFSWDTAQSGILQSSFFYGFALSQIPGGFLNTKFGGARVLPLGLTFISLATLAIPLAGDNLPALFFARALVGLGEGVVPSAVTDIIARAMPVGERSRAVAFTFSGFNVGSILGLSVAPFIMEKTGWRGMFDIFGSFGALWIVLALGLFAAGGVTTKAIDEGKTPVTNLFGSRQEADQEPGKPKEEITFENVPWGQFANSDPIKALAFVHFVGNWGTYVVLAWLPTYFTQEVGLSLTNASLLTLLPPIANIAVGTLAGPTAFAMLLSTYFEDPVATVILLTIGISFQSFSYAGLYSNHQDLSPKYASILLGITNTCGALPGVIGVPLTGYLIKETQEWELSMFGPAIILYSLGIAAYWKWGSGERLVFETKVNVE